MSTPSSQRAPSPDRALACLAWAERLATTTPGELDGVAPPLPTRDEMRAVPIALLREHVDALLVGKNPEPGLDFLEASGALACFMPEVASLVGFGDGEWRHKDVWKHTKQVVRQSVRRLEVRWAALLHDIGKPRTRKIEPDGQVTFYGHAEVGAAMFRRRVAQRLGFEGEQYDRVHFLILHHLRASQYDGSWTDSAVRRFYVQMGDGLRDLLDLSRADITTKRPERKRRGVRMISELSRRIDELRAEDERVPPLPKGLGNLLMSHFGLPPSKRVGEIRRQLEGEVEAGELEPGRSAEHYVAWIESRRERYGL